MYFITNLTGSAMHNLCKIVYFILDAAKSCLFVELSIENIHRCAVIKKRLYLCSQGVKHPRVPSLFTRECIYPWGHWENTSRTDNVPGERFRQSQDHSGETLYINSAIKNVHMHRIKPCTRLWHQHYTRLINFLLDIFITIKVKK